MASFEKINYSIRTNKNVERKLLFEALRKLDQEISLRKYQYIGMGSLWFVDFILAHRYLSIQDMTCIEYESYADRVEFNRPYDCIKVIAGSTSDILPDLELEKKLSLIWLDYDTGVEGPFLEDIEFIASTAKVGTTIFVTLNAHPNRLPKKDPDGKDIEPEESLRMVFGDLVPSNFQRKLLSLSRYPNLLSNMLLSHFQNSVHRSGRGNKFIPILNIFYSDGAPMITIGGIIADDLHEDLYIKSGIDKLDWVSGKEQISLSIPPLTLKEKVAFDRLLPRSNLPTIGELGFPLTEEQIESYNTYYKYYPIFGEIAY